MSSIASALRGRGFLVDEDKSNPGTLNAWLRSKGGYNKDNDLDEAVIPKISPQNISWTCKWCGAFRSATVFNISDIAAQLQKGHVVIANVDDGDHFVLVTGYNISHDKIYVNDSGFTRNCYPMTEVVGWRIFKMEGHDGGTECNGYGVYGENRICPKGELLCNYLPGKSQCCTQSESCVMKVGCRC